MGFSRQEYWSGLPFPSPFNILPKRWHEETFWEVRTCSLFTMGNLSLTEGFPDSSVGKESACNAGDLGSIPGLGRSPGGGHGNPLQYSGLENPHGQRSLVGYSPWDHKESDMTERLSTAPHVYSLLHL